ncbi:hypothetical protein HPP92_028437 [Vanilla planifolia]|uniref:Uncharacterized protein n=1 Tax=Vanilla planifolia TaxID=51239 RepID=A0A835U2L2_VANPL|nr:hypothetical protein HPP92_028437 [Vanilla planifolia]
MGDKLHRREGNSPDHQLRPLNDRSVIKEVGVHRQPGAYWIERPCAEDERGSAICRSCGMSTCIGRGAFRLRGKHPRKQVWTKRKRECRLESRKHW